MANYHVSTGNYTEWNSGWQYRNDGVDITFATDPVHSNGYKVSWLATDEWMKYTVDVQTGGLYDIRMRVSVGETPGMVHFETAGGDVSGYVEIPLSGIPGGWQTITVEDVYLEAGPVGLVFWADAGGFEVSHFDFSFTGTPASEVDFSLVNAKTQGPHHVAVTLNKPMQLPLLDAAGDFTLYADGAPLTLLSSQADPDENRVIVLEVEEGMDATMDLTLSYNGTTVVESGGNDLVAFVNEEVFNDLDFRFAIPGWIEAEAFSQQTGVELEATSDNGGGQNVGFLDEGDVMEYEVNVRYSGDYEVNIRTASESAGSLSMELVGENGQVTGLGMFSLPATGGWQTWATSSKDVVLDAGIYKLRVTVESAPFNLNWYEFEYKDEIVDEGGVTSFQTVLAYPNPVQSGEVTVAFSVFFPQNLTLSVYDAQGRPVFGETYYDVVSIQETLSLQGLAAGVYEVFVHREDGTINTGRFLKPVR